MMVRGSVKTAECCCGSRKIFDVRCAPRQPFEHEMPGTLRDECGQAYAGAQGG